MERKRCAALLLSLALTAGTLAACAEKSEPRQGAEGQPDSTPLEVTIATPQVGEAPKKTVKSSWLSRNIRMPK
nr:hypothetical protein [Paenibacillus sp. JMULE4]